ncbi:ferrous iron transport protein B [Clostridium sp. MSJ-4]|uniref:Ferrous iron transport protein B n=1 Tax=Clostridium simiarum TaxID=2841506 RepID=A0ABS6F183_9CLOT|nr:MULTISPECIES: ferrous iron transport protein B [Clostridium]MBU5592264.1 ferrous iron transport protein B [Clostridium simiarum]
MITIALAGNPNCGKTSLFNVFTGARQHVGNWPGVTVEKKEGILKKEDKEFKVVDLPGTYSLGAYSEDEVVARNFILDGGSQAVINVVDATNLERNLYLTVQMLEMGANVIVALNMMDEAEKQGVKIDVKALSKALGIPVVPTVVIKKKGVEELISATEKHSGAEGKILHIDYGKELNDEIDLLESKLQNVSNKLKYSARWIAIKLLENDTKIKEQLESLNETSILSEVNLAIDRVTKATGFEPEMSIVDKRYTYITSITENILKRKQASETLSDKIDRIVTNKFLGLPIFALIMYFVYELTFKIGKDIFQDTLEGWIGTFGEWASEGIAALTGSDFIGAFIQEAVIGGVGTVISFLPLIMVMYLLIGLLEDSGYMARAAYVMDRIMRSLGLHGKTFISMIVSTGCNVPGIMATRTLESKKDRMIAILINPFVSCGARLPVYGIFIAAFFPHKEGLVLFSLYALGIIVALICGFILSKTVFKGESSYFVMELPPYRMPSIKNVLTLMWDKAGAFFKKAFVVILPVMTILWFLSVMPFGVEQYSDESILGRIGMIFAPILAPAGFGTWQASISLLAGILAKESVTGTMGMIYAGTDAGEALIAALGTIFTPLTAVSFMVMSLLYTPCIVALGAVKRETNSWKWTIFTAVYTFIVAYIVSVLIYQIGSLLGFA